MALDNYSNLKAAIITFAGDNDIAGILDDCIDITESRIFANAQSPLRIRQMETSTTSVVSTSSRFLTLPTDYLEMRRFKLVLSGNDQDILYRTPDQLQEVAGGGKPKFFTVTDQIEFDRIPDSGYTVDFQYYKRITALSDANPTNDILTNFPEIYLHGILSVVGEYRAEEDKADRHHIKFINAIKGANKQDRKGRHGPGAVVRVEGSTP